MHKIVDGRFWKSVSVAHLRKSRFLAFRQLQRIALPTIRSFDATTKDQHTTTNNVLPLRSSSGDKLEPEESKRQQQHGLDDQVGLPITQETPAPSSSDSLPTPSIRKRPQSSALSQALASQPWNDASERLAGQIKTPDVVRSNCEAVAVRKSEFERKTTQRACVRASSDVQVSPHQRALEGSQYHSAAQLLTAAVEDRDKNVELIEWAVYLQNVKLGPYMVLSFWPFNFIPFLSRKRAFTQVGVIFTRSRRSRYAMNRNALQAHAFGVLPAHLLLGFRFI